MTWDRNSVAGQSPDERIRELEATVADRDQLIAHLRERYEWLRNRVEQLTLFADIGPREAKQLKETLEEPTP